MHFDPTISLGNILTAVAFLVGAAFAWRDHEWRIRNVETWKEAHLHALNESMRNISMLREAVVRLTEIQRAAERRLEIIENRSGIV